MSYDLFESIDVIDDPVLEKKLFVNAGMAFYRGAEEEEVVEAVVGRYQDHELVDEEYGKDQQAFQDDVEELVAQFSERYRRKLQYKRAVQADETAEEVFDVL